MQTLVAGGPSTGHEKVISRLPKVPKKPVAPAKQYAKYICPPSKLDYNRVLDEVSPPRYTQEWVLWEFNRCFVATVVPHISAIMAFPRIELFYFAYHLDVELPCKDISSLNYLIPSVTNYSWINTPEGIAYNNEVEALIEAWFKLLPTWGFTFNFRAADYMERDFY